MGDTVDLAVNEHVIGKTLGLFCQQSTLLQNLESQPVVKRRLPNLTVVSGRIAVADAPLREPLPDK